MAGYGYSSYRISMRSQIAGGPSPKPFAPFVPSQFNGNGPPSEGYVTKKKIVPVASRPYADDSDDDSDGDEWKHQRQTSPIRGCPSNSSGDYRGNKPVVGGTINKSHDGYDNGTNYGNKQGTKPFGGATKNGNHDGYNNGYGDYDGTNYGYGDYGGNKEGRKRIGGSINHDGYNNGYGGDCGNKEGRNLIDSPVKKDNYGGYGSLSKKDNNDSYGNPVKKDNHDGYGSPVKKDNYGGHGSLPKKDNYGGYGNLVKKDNQDGYESLIKKDNHDGYGSPVKKDNYGSYGNPIKKDYHDTYGSPVKKDNYNGGYGNPVKKDNRERYGSPAKTDNYDGYGDYNNKEGPKLKPTGNPVYNNGYGGYGIGNGNKPSGSTVSPTRGDDKYDDDYYNNKNKHSEPKPTPSWSASPRKGTTPLTKTTNDIGEAIELLKNEAANRGYNGGPTPYEYDDNNPHQRRKDESSSLSSRPVQPYDREGMDLVNETERLKKIVTGAPQIQSRISVPVTKDETTPNRNLNRPRFNFADGRHSNYGVINHREAEKRFNGMTI